MIIRTRDAEYVQAVIDALAAGTAPVPYLTTACPECQEEQTYFYNDAHVVVLDDEDDPGAPVTVVIGCEGYWVVNPALVGIDSPNWQDWKIGQFVERALAWIRDGVADGDYPDGAPTSTADLPADEAHEIAGVPWSDTDGGHDLLNAFYTALDERLQNSPALS